MLLFWTKILISSFGTFWRFLAFVLAKLLLKSETLQRFNFCFFLGFRKFACAEVQFRNTKLNKLTHAACQIVPLEPLIPKLYFNFLPMMIPSHVGKIGPKQAILTL